VHSQSAHRANDVKQVLKLVIGKQMAKCAGYSDVRRSPQPQQATTGQRRSKASVYILQHEQAGRWAGDGSSRYLTTFELQHRICTAMLPEAGPHHLLTDKGTRRRLLLLPEARQLPGRTPAVTMCRLHLC
jgi:hypothetical protein